MLTSIPVKDFIDPTKGSRPWNAIMRAVDTPPFVHKVGEFATERFYRVQRKGSERHLVIIWPDKVSEEEVASCDCPAFTIPVSGPNHCVHVAAVLIFEANQFITSEKLKAVVSNEENDLQDR